MQIGLWLHQETDTGWLVSPSCLVHNKDKEWINKKFATELDRGADTSGKWILLDVQEWLYTKYRMDDWLKHEGL